MRIPNSYFSSLAASPYCYNHCLQHWYSSSFVDLDSWQCTVSFYLIARILMIESACQNTNTFSRNVASLRTSLIYLHCQPHHMIQDVEPYTINFNNPFPLSIILFPLLCSPRDLTHIQQIHGWDVTRRGRLEFYINMFIDGSIRSGFLFDC